VTAYDLQELSDAKDKLRHEFNFDIRENGWHLLEYNI
jgi:hypothetical protein